MYGVFFISVNDFIYIKYGGVEIKSILMSHAFMETTNMRCVISGTDGRGAHSADTQWYMFYGGHTWNN